MRKSRNPVDILEEAEKLMLYIAVKCEPKLQELRERDREFMDRNRYDSRHAFR